MSSSSLRAKIKRVTDETMAMYVKGPRISKFLIAVVALLFSLPALANAQIEVTEASIAELQEAMESDVLGSGRKDQARIYGQVCCRGS